MTEINQNMMVKDSFSEAGNPNQNPAESLGVRVVKSRAEALMNHTGTPAQYWPWAHKYIADINNHCATPFLNWEVPITKRHGYTPDISPFLQYQFYEKIYYKTEEKALNAKEQAGYWLGVSHTVGDLLTYDILTDDTENIIQRSVIRSADPKRGGFPNLRVPHTLSQPEDESETESDASQTNTERDKSDNNVSKPTKPVRSKRPKPA